MMYYVFSPLRGKPTVIHNCYESAVEEAGRLAMQEDTPFEILAIVSIVRPHKQYEVEKLC